jgi:acid phosphatase type 7
VRTTWLVVGAVVFGSLVVLLLGSSIGQEREARAAADPVLLGAGDIASCESQGDEATARLLDDRRGRVVTLGDNAYPDGTLSQFNNCYGPSWGRHKDRTRPSAGNHEYNTPQAAGYFDYFGARAGNPSKGYYSYDRGQWHVVVLNSNCWEVSCQVGSAQERWLRADLAAHPAKCTLAYFHYPRFSSSGNNKNVAPFWSALYEAGAEVVLNGHSHNYERFAPQRPDGTLAPERGIREFVVGTGGAHHHTFSTSKPNSQVRNATAYGVLKLTLHAGSYTWKFIPQAGKTFTDSGTTGCH